MRTDQEPTSSAPESRDRRIADTSGEWEQRGGELDRRGMQRAMTDALADILRWEASVDERASRAARH